MQWRNNEARYGAISKGFHWIGALMVIGLLAVGLYMEDLENTPWKFELYGLHKATGALLLALVTLRLAWRLREVRLAVPDTLSAAQKRAAKGAHTLLYLLMFAMPLTGWAMSSAAGYPVKFYGLFTLPDLVSKDKELAGLFNQAHEYIAYGLIALIVLHVVAAFYHHVKLKDDTLRRMLP